MNIYFSLNILLYFCIILIFSKEEVEGELRWAFEIFRYGARTPSVNKNENFTDFKDCFGHKWNGNKELTGVGVRQHFLVGYRNRIRYMNESNLINPEYDPREVFLISTDSNRTLMSASAQVQGLYLPGTGPLLSENQSEIAVPPVEEGIFKEEKEKLDNDSYTVLPNRMNIMPVHNFFVKEHFIELEDEKNCPNVKSIYEENKNSKEVKVFLEEMNKKYGENLINFLVNEDDKNDSLTNYTKAYYIFDTIISHYTEGLDDFENITKALNVSKEELLNDSFKFFEYDLNRIDNNSELCLHVMSPVFNRLIEWMDLKKQKDEENETEYIGYDLPKFVMFSTDDSTCAAFMGFMKAVFGTEIKYPYFATNINLELFIKKEEGNDTYYVRYIINDEYIGEYKYDEFVEKIKKRLKKTSEIDSFCGFAEEEENKKDSINVYVIVNIILSALSMILIITILLTIKKKKSDGSRIEIEKAEPLNPITED